MNLHVALVCVDSVEQSFWCHPFHWQTPLQRPGDGELHTVFNFTVTL